MKTNRMRAFPLVLLVICFSASTRAAEGRAQSLLFNLAFEDATDVFLFPELLTEYEGVYLHLPASVTGAHGGVILDFEGQALGAFVHRPFASAFDQYRIVVTDSFGSNLGMFPGLPGSASEPHLAGQVLDVMYGNGQFGAGLRLHGWSEVSRQEGVLADPAEANSAFMAAANLGFKLSNSAHLHVLAGFREVADWGSTIQIRSGFRWIQPDHKRIRPVLAGEMQLAVFAPPAGASSFGLGIPLRGGVRYEAIEGRLTLGLLAGLDIQFLKEGEDDGRFGLAVPTLELGVELAALSWLQLRTAIKSGYGFQLAGEAGGNHPKYEQLAFSSGLGFMLGVLNIDAVIQYGLWQNGPYFVGGMGGLFAGVSLTYLWDRQATEPTPATVPERAVPAAGATEQPATPTASPNLPADQKPAAAANPSFEGWRTGDSQPQGKAADQPRKPNP